MTLGSPIFPPHIAPHLRTVPKIGQILNPVFAIHTSFENFGGGRTQNSRISLGFNQKFRGVSAFLLSITRSSPPTSLVPAWTRLAKNSILDHGAIFQCGIFHI